MKPLLMLFLATSLFIAGCGVPRAARGEYNLALCSREGYIALHAVVSGGEVSITDMNPGPGQIVHAKDPFVFKAAGRQDGYFKFVKADKTGGQNVLLLKVVNGNLEGKIIYADGSEQIVAGVKHPLSELPKDGFNGFQGCLAVNGVSDGAGPDATASSQQ